MRIIISGVYQSLIGVGAHMKQNHVGRLPVKIDWCEYMWISYP
jgi:hypothetical protein